MNETVARWLREHQAKDMLRFLTCGSVDDGKSTLIGRLLYDTAMVPEDQLAAVARDSERHGTVGRGRIDLALLTDGLKAEREQGITIDVAYRFFTSPRRKFIIADCPGHAQYTRNMATGASTCQLAVILVDARHGVLEQTRRHACIVSLLGIRHVVLAVNKMDLVGWDEAVFRRIVADFRAVAERVGLSASSAAIPLSALDGDYVVRASERAPWYRGPTLLEHLERVPLGDAEAQAPWRLPVQLALRPDREFRGFAGALASGRIALGARVLHLPSRQQSRIVEIRVAGDCCPEARAPQSVIVRLADEIDCARGDVLADPEQPPAVSSRLEAWLIWMHEQPLTLHTTYWWRGAAGYVPAQVTGIAYELDVNTLAHRAASTLGLNGIARVSLELARPVACEPYGSNRVLGSFVLVDRSHCGTLAAGMVIGCDSEGGSADDARAARRRILGHRGALIAVADAARARALAEALLAHGIVAVLLDEQRVPALPAVARELAAQDLVVLLICAAPPDEALLVPAELSAREAAARLARCLHPLSDIEYTI
ncbi:MAG: GTP-binding protein [Planctomycetota bacterium]|nr:GTP-binding protein [Planctomycetota bacterium]MCX8039440.1 GTP-binding protein [Planctomycetota bacterium]MDW8373559.1 GTP-binding protein [Planctomycetota bacterium]